MAMADLFMQDQLQHVSCRRDHEIYASKEEDTSLLIQVFELKTKLERGRFRRSRGLEPVPQLILGRQAGSQIGAM